MRIDELKIQNFRGFEDQTFPFHPQFNVIVGANGSGKTALLEALNVAMGSFFMGIKNVSTRHIRSEDIRLASTEFSEEEQYPVIIEAKGVVDDHLISWKRKKDSIKGRTTQKGGAAIKNVAESMDERVRKAEPVVLPLLAYYSTGRLWLERKGSGKTRTAKVASRFRGYFNCLEASSNFKDFLAWFRGKELSQLQRQQDSPDKAYSAVRKVIVDNLPGAIAVYNELDPDKPSGLKAELEDGRVLPFRFLSDGTRNLLALMADIAYRAVILNPALGETAPAETPGIVLIDELDLHLHPEWQKLVVSSLRNTFPKVQFITTTHSPFIIQETAYGELIGLVPGGFDISGGDDQSLEDIAEYIQNLENPQWSHKRMDMYRAAKEYYQLLEEIEQRKPIIVESKTNELQELRERLDDLVKPFSDNIAYVAFLEQQRLRRDR